MKNDLPCAVVRDLMPSYLEGLTEKETSELVARHLENCPECAACYTVMKEPEKIREEEKVQVDYLKKVRRSSWKRVAAAVVCACLVLMGGIGTKLFAVGSPLNGESFYYDAAVKEDTLVLNLEMTGSALAFGSCKTETKGNDVMVRARSVLASSLNRSDHRTAEIPLDDVQRVYVMDQLVYQDGWVIDQKTNRMFQNRTPYVGSMSKVAALARYLPLPQAAFTNQLYTEKEPYGWQLNFEEPLTQDQQKQMRQAAALALALVDNLGDVRYTLNGKAGTEEQIAQVTLEKVNAVLPELAARCTEAGGPALQAKPSVKDYASSAAELQQLVELLKYWNDPM